MSNAISHDLEDTSLESIMSDMANETMRPNLSKRKLSRMDREPASHAGKVNRKTWFSSATSCGVLTALLVIALGFALGL